MKRKTSHKRHGFISMFWMPLTLYLVMLVTSFVVLTWHDTRNVWEAMDETLDFAVARLEQYSNAMSNDRAMSEIRLLDKTAELAARIAEAGLITNEQLDQYAYAQRLTGIVILDADHEHRCPNDNRRRHGGGAAFNAAKADGAGDCGTP